MGGGISLSDCLRVDDVGSILNLCVGFYFEKKSALAGQSRLGFRAGFGDPCSFQV